VAVPEKTIYVLFSLIVDVFMYYQLIILYSFTKCCNSAL
jgi:hypothetical protein